MYQKDFYIEWDVGNNGLSFQERKNILGYSPQLFVPALKKIQDISEIFLLNWNDNTEVTFQDFDFDGELQTCYGLENIYQLEWRGTPLYLFDNHNHALYFWYKARNEWVVWDNATLFHIDEHADYRDPGDYISKAESCDLEKVFHYTHFSSINVGNYIIPAEKEWLIGKTYQIRSTKELELYESSLSKSKKESSIILNLDLDFFQPDLDFICYDLKKKVVLDISHKADLITVATSPFFIDQKLALSVFEDLFYK